MPVAAAPATGAAPREINITTDSAPGWLPSEEQELQARQAMERYFDALESEQYERAYAMMTEGNRALQPLARFVEQRRESHRLTGALRQRRVVRITWTKDPANAPAPGVYAAIDLASQFANVDRHCGYVIAYQPPAGGDFQIARLEQNFIDNATARNIVRSQSQAELDRLWGLLAANCPNYSTGAPN